MGSSLSRPVVRSGSIGTILPYHNRANLQEQRINRNTKAILAGFLKNKLTGSLYGLTAGTQMKHGESFCIAISPTLINNLPSELVQYAREVNECKFIEIGKCILHIDDIDVSSFRPSNDYTHKTSVALIEIHDQIRKYFVLDLRDTDGEAMTVNIRDPIENLEVYYKNDGFRNVCKVTNVNTGVFSIRQTDRAYCEMRPDHDHIMLVNVDSLTPRHDDIRLAYVGGLIQSDDTDQQTSVYGMIFTFVRNIHGSTLGWAVPMRIILQRLEEALGFEVRFLQPPHRRAPLQTVQEAYRAFNRGRNRIPSLSSGPFRTANLYNTRVERYCYLLGASLFNPVLWVILYFGAFIIRVFYENLS